MGQNYAIYTAGINADWCPACRYHSRGPYLCPGIDGIAVCREGVRIAAVVTMIGGQQDHWRGVERLIEHHSLQKRFQNQERENWQDNSSGLYPVFRHKTSREHLTNAPKTCSRKWQVRTGPKSTFNANTQRPKRPFPHSLFALATHPLTPSPQPTHHRPLQFRCAYVIDQLVSGSCSGLKIDNPSLGRDCAAIGLLLYIIVYKCSILRPWLHSNMTFRAKCYLAHSEVFCLGWRPQVGEHQAVRVGDILRLLSVRKPVLAKSNKRNAYNKKKAPTNTTVETTITITTTCQPAWRVTTARRISCTVFFHSRFSSLRKLMWMWLNSTHHVDILVRSVEVSRFPQAKPEMILSEVLLPHQHCILGSPQHTVPGRAEHSGSTVEPLTRDRSQLHKMSCLQWASIRRFKTEGFPFGEEAIETSSAILGSWRFILLLIGIHSSAVQSQPTSCICTKAQFG